METARLENPPTTPKGLYFYASPLTDTAASTDPKVRAELAAKMFGAIQDATSMILASRVREAKLSIQE